MMTEEWMQVLAAGLVVGLALGFFMQRESRRRKKIYGGFPAEIFHYLASSTISGLIPVIFIALFAGLNFWRIVGSGLSFSITTFLLLLIYGFFENRVGPVVEEIVLTD
ncbi:MAG: hypothetical protein KJ064_11595 [Anaerolineae bacterium]|jgi:hypothetical protein|nr:hypothetical protein [Anaerolineae bacterium]